MFYYQSLFQPTLSLSPALWLAVTVVVSSQLSVSGSYHLLTGCGSYLETGIDYYLDTGSGGYIHTGSDYYLETDCDY